MVLHEDPVALLTEMRSVLLHSVETPTTAWRGVRILTHHLKYERGETPYSLKSTGYSAKISKSAQETAWLLNYTV